MQKATLPFSEAFYQELLGFGLGTIGITCRVLAGLASGLPNALALEGQAQRMAQRTFTLSVDHIVSSGFFCGICLWATADEWRVAVTTGDHALVKKAWMKWNAMIGRKPHSESVLPEWRKEVDDLVKSFLEGRSRTSGGAR